MTKIGSAVKILSVLLLAAGLSACGQKGFQSQKVGIDGLTGGANADGRNYTAFGDPADLQKAAEGLRDNGSGLIEPIAQNIKWITINQKTQDNKPFMEVVVQYRDDATGKTTPVRFRGEITNNGGKGSVAQLTPILPAAPQTTPQPKTGSPSTTLTVATIPTIPGLSSIEVQCSGDDCSKADVSFLDSKSQKLAAAVVRHQESSVDLKSSDSDAPLATAASGTTIEDRKIQVVTDSVEVVNGRTAIQITEQNSDRPLKLKGEIVETNEGRVRMHSNQPDVRAHLIGNSRDGQIVIELEKATPPQTISTPAESTRAPTPPAAPTKPVVVPPPSATNPPKTTPVATRPVTATQGPAKAPQTKQVTSPPKAPPQTSTRPNSPPAKSYIVIGGNGPTTGGLPTFDFCPNIPQGTSSAAKAIREACEHTFWTNRPEYKTTLAEHKRDKKPPGALAFFTEGSVDRQSFEKFLNLFSGKTTDPRQTHFTIMADAFRQAAISIAWSFVPYVETRFRTLERIFGPAIKNKNSPQYGHRAGGVFQFMPSTARRYGLSEEDRFDMTKAAPAAARFMSFLENHQGDFLLAVASYNRGEGGIDQDTIEAESALIAAQSKGSFNHDAIKGFTSDWWKILHFNMAPKETQHYVIRVVSGIIFAMNPQKHGLASQPITID